MKDDPVWVQAFGFPANPLVVETDLELLLIRFVLAFLFWQRQRADAWWQLARDGL